MPKKKSKLTEKATRIPDTRQVQWDEAISQYLHEVQPLNKEQARSHRFAMLVQQLLSVEPNFIESYSAGIEQSLKVRQKDRILKGEADNLFGNVIIDDPIAANVVGINPEKIIRTSFAIGSALAGAAGILISFETNIEPTMGFSALLKGIIASIVGGIGSSIPGAVLGEFLS